jgi:hypothetical protein
LLIIVIFHIGKGLSHGLHINDHDSNLHWGSDDELAVKPVSTQVKRVHHKDEIQVKKLKEELYFKRAQRHFSALLQNLILYDSVNERLENRDPNQRILHSARPPSDQYKSDYVGNPEQELVEANILVGRDYSVDQVDIHNQLPYSYYEESGF